MLAVTQGMSVLARDSATHASLVAILFALRIAAMHGAEVIVTSSSDEKLARTKALRAAHGVNRATAGVVKEVSRLSVGRDADLVLGLVGGENFTRSVEAVSVGGRISVIGLLGGLELRAPTTPIPLKASVIQGIVTGQRRALEDLVGAVDRVRIKPVINHFYPFGELPAALDLADRGAFGKIVLDIPSQRS